ncbi:MAG: hypothetical protein RMJ88_15520 [Thermogemmata sp.]|nr:hypothetical protein [Thermogemmata sp.]
MIGGLRLLDNEQPDPMIYGNKANGLWRLLKCGARIPPTILIACDYVPSIGDVVLIAERLGNPREYIVRSSTTLEDSAAASFAGVFVSEKKVELAGLLTAIARCREHAFKSLIGSREQKAIPLLIQPMLYGPGGVYLFDRHSGRDSLALSTLGPSAVTAGTTTCHDQLPTTSNEFQNALRSCRELAYKLNESIDLEILIIDGECIFLQLRHLTRPLVPLPQVGMNAYFPSWLPPLCGTLWVEQLQKNSSLVNVRYEAGFIKWNEHDLPHSLVHNLSSVVLDKAQTYYTNELFPKWDKAISCLVLDCDKMSPEEQFRSTLRQWDLFWTEYFNNPYEAVLTAVRMMVPTGMALTPRVRDRLQLFTLAARQVREAICSNLANTCELLALPAVKLYLERYGYHLLGGYDFSQPTLAEQPEILIRQLRQADVAILPTEVGPVDLLTQVGWLIEDDNEYKYKFCALLRRSILRLAEEWVCKGWLTDKNQIWQLTEDEVKRGILGYKPVWEQMYQFDLIKQAPIATKTVKFPAVILSPGRATGYATRTASSDSNLILLRPVIDSIDYPLIVSCAGAVVAIGTEQCHGAVFARDIGKPLYLCPAVVSEVPDGSRLVLNDTPPSVEWVIGHSV